MREIVLPDGTVIGTLKDGVAPPTKLPNGDQLPKGTQIIEKQPEFPPAQTDSPYFADPMPKDPSMGPLVGGVLGMTLAPALAPQIAAGGLGGIATNLGLRSAWSGLGNVAGRQIGNLAAGQPMDSPKEMAFDFGLGAGGEVAATALVTPIAWALKHGGAFARGAANAMRGSEMIQGGMKELSGELAGKAFSRLKSMFAPDMPIPANNVLPMLRRIVGEGASGEELAAITRMKPGLRSRLQKIYQAAGQDAWEIGSMGTAEATKTIPAAGFMGKGWKPFYMVFDDGKGVLFWTNPSGKFFREGSKVYPKAKEFLSMKNLTRYIGAQNKGANIVGTIPAEPFGEGFAPRIAGLTISRSESIPFKHMNELMAETTSADKWIPSHKELWEGLRDAVRADIKATSKKAAKTVNMAFGFGRAAKTGTAAGKMAKPALKLGTKAAAQRIGEDYRQDMNIAP